LPVEGLLFGSTLLVALLGGVVALFAPCCVSVMLPAFFASTFRTSRSVVAMTLVFGVGVATVIVPLGLGAAAVSAQLVRLHTPLFGVAGLLMLAVGAAMLLGWKPMFRWLPTAPTATSGPLGVYALGVFSGIASACCAPVLVGVAVLSGSSGSFPVALAVAVTYVIGMVLPLLAISLLWDRREWGTRSWLATRTLKVRGRDLTAGSLLSGVVLVLMGAVTLVTAVRGPMATDGWRLRVAAWLQHQAANVTDWAGWVPGWVFIAGMTLAAGWLAREIRRTRSQAKPRQSESSAPLEDTSHGR
jgi:cytochrome c biogenesis protein CcdA